MNQENRTLAANSFSGDFRRFVAFTRTCGRLGGTLATILFMLNVPDMARGQAVNVQDSLALVALYDATNGDGWLRNDNWKSGPVVTWFGVSVSAGRVVNLDLASNQLAGPLPQELNNLEELEVLNIAFNQLTGSVPLLDKLTKLRLLLADFNQLEGPIPSWLNELTTLENLRLPNNRFEGPIPVLNNLTNLIGLSLESNRLSGPIPPWIGTLTNLSALSLTDNGLSGAIPEELGQLVNLTDLSLGFCELTGAVPASFSQLTNLRFLHLLNNRLEDLPDLSVLSALQLATLQNNAFTFEDLEPLAGFIADPAVTVFYSPQDSIKTTVTWVGSDVVLSVSDDAVNNMYQWFQDGVAIPGAIETNYTIQDADPADKTKYYCEITNTIVPGLTLYSRKVTTGLNIAIMAEPVRSEIKLGGDLTAIKVTVVDTETGETNTDFNGNALYRIVDEMSTEGVRWRLTDIISLVENGVAQDVFFETTGELFDENTVINPSTVLSGEATIEVSLEGQATPPVLAKVKVKSGFDFFIDRVEIQQGVKETAQGETAPTLPFTANHTTVVRIFVGYENNAVIPFKKILGIGGLSGELTIFQGENIIEMISPEQFQYTFRDTIEIGVANENDYSVVDRVNLRDALSAFIVADRFGAPGLYTFDAKLSLDSDLLAQKIESREFAATKGLKLLTETGDFSSQDNVPFVSTTEFDFLRNAYPVEASKVQFTNPNSRHYDSTNPNFADLEYSLDRYNSDPVNSGNKRDRLVLFSNSTIFVKTICEDDPEGQDASLGCAKGRVSIINLNEHGVSNTIAHEIGHSLGLNDTYAGSPFTGEPNPRRSDATDEGNLVEEGNVHSWRSCNL